MANTARAHINLAALRKNLQLVRTLSPQSRIMAVVKANAYGHGLLVVAKALDTVDGFAVARLEEAQLLRQSGTTQRILLLGTNLSTADLTTCAELNIDIVVHNHNTLEAIQQLEGSRKLAVWVKMDTGMHRLGFSPSQFIPALEQLKLFSAVKEITLMSHFISSESSHRATTEKQLEIFQRETKNQAFAVSLANSGAIFNHPDSHCDWVRPGIMLYGASPGGACSVDQLEPVMTLSSSILAIRSLDAGETVGYGGNWRSDKQTRIATIGIGYGDGYPRHAANGTPVKIGNSLVPLVGRVSMDLITVNLGITPANVGDSVTLWGEGLPATSVAKHAKTIAYDLFTGVTARVERIYHS
jgi:alanine racemase